MAARTVFPGAERLADEVHRELHGTPLPFPVLDWPRHAEAIVQFTVPEFEYPRSDAPATLHFAGPISATGSRAALPPGGATSTAHAPSCTSPRARSPTATTARSSPRPSRHSPTTTLLVVVSTGGRPLDTLPPLPRQRPRRRSTCPTTSCCPKTDVYVTNGGYGGVQYALRYGVPIVTSSGQEDKPEVAGRVAWSGVGRRLKSETPDTGRRPQGRPHRARRPPVPGPRAAGLPQHGPSERHRNGLTQIVDNLASRRLP